MPLPEPFVRAIAELKKLPGIGEKTASRLAFFILTSARCDPQALAAAIADLRTRIRHCSVCFDFTEADPCPICDDPRRDSKTICVVEEPSDLMAIEKTGGYRGRYHVLLGALAPVEGIGPDQLKVKELVARIEKGGIEEVIVATNPSVAGEATAIYLSRTLRPLGVKVTRIARGLPMGSDLEYADAATIESALKGRGEI